MTIPEQGREGGACTAVTESSLRCAPNSSAPSAVWRPIETAPKDGAAAQIPVLLWDGYDVTAGRWIGETSLGFEKVGWYAMASGLFVHERYQNTGSSHTLLYPSHWMPLPEPPGSSTPREPQGTEAARSAPSAEGK